MIAKCQNEQCEKKDRCLRYTTKDGAIVEFKNICKEKNNYVWFWDNKALTKNK